MLVGTGAFVSCRAGEEPERRALAFLEREVPRWHRENRCFSCHNNGDAARALFVARSSRFAENRPADEATVGFLSRPDRWDANGGDEPFSDRTLARVQFSAALTEAVASGATADPDALAKAAGLVAGDQTKEGFWPIDEAAAVGSPATYGPPVATSLAVKALRRAGRKADHPAIEKAEAWVRGRPIQNVHDAFAVLTVLTTERDRQTIEAATGFLRQSQNDDGGWGPFAQSPSEAFDTALALIGLARATDSPAIQATRRRGRTYLLNAQNDDGGWPGTTRPAGGESYAERISTSAWATMGLLATEDETVRASKPGS